MPSKLFIIISMPLKRKFKQIKTAIQYQQNVNTTPRLQTQNDDVILILNNIT